jgi:hypothetical protein
MEKVAPRALRQVAALRNASTRLASARLAAPLACSPMAIWSRRQFTTTPNPTFPGGPTGMGSSGPSSPTYFQRQSSLPANTIIRFVPQQTAWIVERMGKFSRILEPGLAILVPVIDVRGVRQHGVLTRLTRRSASPTCNHSRRPRSRFPARVLLQPIM